MPPNQINIPVALQPDVSPIKDALLTLKQGIAGDPMQIKFQVPQGKLVLGDTQKFIDDITASTTNLEKLTLVYKQFTDTTTGQSIVVPTQMMSKLSGEAGTSSENITQLNLEIRKLIEANKDLVETDSSKVMLNVGEASRKLESAYMSQGKSVRGATQAAVDFLAKSKNMTGTQVEEAKAIALEVKLQGEAYEKAYSNKNIEAMRAAAEAIKKLTPAFKEATAATNRGAGALRGWADNILNAVKQTIAYSISLGSLRTAQSFLADGIRYVTELNKELVNVQLLQAEGAQTPEEINALAQSFNNLAKELGATTVEVARGSVEWLRQGKTIAETQELLRASTMLSKLGNIEAAQSTEYLTATINSFGMETEDVISIVDKLVAVDNVSATSVKELATALQYSAASAKQAGVSFEQLISYVAVISQTTRLNAEQIGQAMKTMLARMEDIKAGAIDSDGLGINNVEQALSRVNMTIMETDTTFRDMGGVLEELAGKWDTLNEVEQANISKAIAGVRQRNMFLVLMENMNEALELQEVQIDSTGLAMDRYQIYLEGVEAAQNRLTASVENLWQNAISSGTITAVLNLTTYLIDLVDTLGGLNTVLAVTATLFVAIKWGAIIEGIYGVTSALIGLEGAIITLDAGATALATGGAAGGLAAIGPAGWIVLGLIAIVGAVALFKAIWPHAFETAAETAGRLNAKLDETNTKIRALNEKKVSILGLATTINDLKKTQEQTGLTVEQTEKLNESLNKLKDLVPTLSGTWDEYGNFILSSTLNMKDLTAATEAEIKERAELAQLQSDAAAVANANALAKAYKDLADANRGYRIERGARGEPIRFDISPEDQAKARLTYKTTLDELRRTFEKASDEYKQIIIDGLTVKYPEAAKMFQAIWGQMKADVYHATMIARDGIDKIDASGIYDFATSSDVQKDISNISEKYQKLAEIVGDSDSTISDTYAALVDLVGEMNAGNYILADGTIALEAVREAELKRLEVMRRSINSSKELDDATKKLFGNMIDEAIRAVSSTASSFDSFMTGMTAVDNAMKSWRETGSLTLQQATALIDAGYASALSYNTETGQIILNESVLRQKILATLDAQLAEAQLALQMAQTNRVAAEQIAVLTQTVTAINAIRNAIMGAPIGTMPINIPFVSAPASGGGGGGGKSAEQERIEKQTKALEEKKQALQDNLDEYNKYIESQKEILRLAKEEADFTDEMLQKERDLAKLKSQIAILALDDSEEAKAQRLKLEEEAAKAEEDITQDKEDRKYDLQIEALEAAQKVYEEMIQAQMDALDDKIEKLRDEQSQIQSNSGAMSGYSSTMQQATYVGISMYDMLAQGSINISNLTDVQVAKLSSYVQTLNDLKYPAQEIITLTQQAIWNLEHLGTIIPVAGTNPYGQRDIGAAPGRHQGGLIEEHHSGNFAGGLKSNEVFAKLLKGEYVATEAQMKTFLEKTLPSMVGHSAVTTNTSNGDIHIEMPINVAGNLDESVVPDIEKVADKVITKLNEAMKRRGRIRPTSAVSI